LAQLIRSAGGPHVPNLVTIHSRGSSWQMDEITFFDFVLFYFSQARVESDPLTDFDA